MDRCPDCKEENCLDMDTARGELACTNCASVIRMGMEESADTVFHDDTTFEDIDRSRVSATAAGSSGFKYGNAIDRYIQRATDYVERLQQTTGAPPAAKETAIHYIRTAVTHGRALNLKNDAPPNLAAVTFELASQIWRWPISMTEIKARYEKPDDLATSAILQDLRRRVVVACSLSTMTPEAVHGLKHTRYIDVASMILTRLNWPQKQYVELVSKLASHASLGEIPGLVLAATPHQLVAGLLYAIRVNEELAKKAGVEVVVIPSRQQAILHAVARTSFEDIAALVKIEASVRKSITETIACLNRPPPPPKEKTDSMPPPDPVTPVSHVPGSQGRPSSQGSEGPTPPTGGSTQDSSAARKRQREE